MLGLTPIASAPLSALGGNTLTATVSESTATSDSFAVTGYTAGASLNETATISDTGDQYWNNTSALLRFNGANNGTTFTDDKGHTVTRSGTGIVTSTTQYLYTSSGYFPGPAAGTNLLALDGSSAFAFSGDFTVEFSIRFNDVATTQIIYDNRGNGVDSTSYFMLYLEGSTGKLSFHLGGGGGDVWTDSAVSTGTWYHVAACRSGSTIRLYLNGTQQTGSMTNSTSFLVGTSRPAIGGSGYTSGAGEQVNGYIEDLRVTKDVARYTASFTAPTSEFPTSAGLFSSVTYNVSVSESTTTSASETPLFVFPFNVNESTGTSTSETVKAFYTCNLAPDTYAITGGVARLNLHAFLDTTSYSTTGAVTYNSIVENSVAGSYTITGVITANNVVTIESPSSYTLTGSPGYLNIGMNSLPSSYSLTGVLTQNSIVSNELADSYLITGYSITNSLTESENVGSYSIVGADTTNVIGWKSIASETTNISSSETAGNTTAVTLNELSVTASTDESAIFVVPVTLDEIAITATSNETVSAYVAGGTIEESMLIGSNEIPLAYYNLNLAPSNYDLIGSEEYSEISFNAANYDYSYNGVDAAVVASRIINSDIGSYNITNLNTSVSLSSNLINSNYIVSGNNTSNNISANALIDSYQLTGNDIFANIGLFLNLQSDSYNYEVTNTSSDYQVNLNSDSITVDGSDAYVLTARIFSAPAGEFNINGVDGIDTKQSLLIGLSGVFTTQYNDISNDINVNLNSAQLIYSGSNTNLDVGKKLILNSGNYNITGVSAYKLMRTSIDSFNVSLSGNDSSFIAVRSLGLNSSSYNVNKVSANLMRSRITSLDYDNYIISSNNVFNITRRKLTSDSSSYDVTGFANQTIKDSKINSNSASYSISGKSSSTIYDRLFNAAENDYSINNPDTKLRIARKIISEYSTYSVSGVSNNLLFGKSTNAAAGAFVISGKLVAAISARKINNDSGTYSITAPESFTLFGRKINNSAGTYVSTGVSSTLLKDYYSNINSYAYEFAGSEAFIDYLYPESSEFLVVGYPITAIYDIPDFYSNNEFIVTFKSKKFTVAYNYIP